MWNPRNLAVEGKWQTDGPRLPIEFARISGGIEGGRLNVASIGYIARDGCSWYAPRSGFESGMREWLQEKKDLDAEIWTDLRSNFKEKLRADFSIDLALAWLRDLKERNEHAETEKYIRSAPPQTRTAMRNQVRREFIWTDDNPPTEAGTGIG